MWPWTWRSTHFEVGLESRGSSGHAERMKKSILSKKEPNNSHQGDRKSWKWQIVELIPSGMIGKWGCTKLWRSLNDSMAQHFHFKKKQKTKNRVSFSINKISEWLRIVYGTNKVVLLKAGHQSTSTKFLLLYHLGGNYHCGNDS